MNELISFDDWLTGRLAQDPHQAAALLCVALEEAAKDPRVVSLPLHYINAAHSGIDDLGLNLTETTALLYALGRHLKPESLQQAV
jgi:hypothetical protein